MGQDMKYEKETTGPKNPNVIVKKSAFEEFLDEFGSWRGKSKAKKAERDSHIVQPRGKRRTKNTEFMDSAFMVVIQLFVVIVEFIMTALSWIFSFLFSFKTLAIIAALVYFIDFDVKTAIIKNVTEQSMEQGIEQTDAIKQSITDALDATKASLKELKINIDKGDGTSININGSDWFDTDKPEPVPFTQTPLAPKE